MTEANSTEQDVQAINWGHDAPKGGKAVLNRMIKEKATVPLFFGQTLIRSLRDSGYNSTTSAICEHVDNSIQWGATEVRIFFNQAGKRGDYSVDVMVLDNGKGMAPNVLKVATSFGGSMVYENRSGIGRYGMGMKTAALSMSPVMDLYSWQENGTIYNMNLDVDQIGKERGNVIELPEPTLLDELPSDIASIITHAMIFPEAHEQKLLAYNSEDLRERLGSSGTIVFMPSCDRLTSVKARTLAEHATRELSRVYRRFIASGIKLYVNNRLLEPSDPTFWMQSARHVGIPELTTTQSRLVLSTEVAMPAEETHKGQDSTVIPRYPVKVRLYALPIEEWGTLPRTIRNNALHLYDGHVISVLRNDREVFAGTIPEIVKRHGDTNWFRIQIDFSGELDEAFGVAANKQGVRPKRYVLEALENVLSNEVTAVREQIKKHQREQTSIRANQKSTGESRADDAEGMQPKQLLEVSPTTPEEQAQLDSNLRTLAMMLKRDRESDEEAFERIKRSKHIIHFRHDEYWPFYHVDHKFGRIILTINTAHNFYEKLYEPLSRAASAVDVAMTNPGEDEDVTPFTGAGDALTALQLLLLSLARTQTSMASASDETKQLFDQFRKEWSNAYDLQLVTP